MDLTGALSNSAFQGVLQSLANKNPHKAIGLRRNQGWSDGRRKFGTVSAAIVTVLSEADSELRVREIRACVEALLGSGVSRHSIKGYLHKECRGNNPRFERLARGRYKLRR